MEMEKIAGLLVYGFLQPFLRGGLCGHVTDTSSGKIKLGKRVHEAFADLGCFRDVC